MKKVLGLSAAVLALALCARPLLSEEGSDKGGEPPAWMELMAPGPEHDVLTKRAGSWVVKGKLFMDPANPSETKGSAEMTSIMGGRFVQMDYKGEMDMGGGAEKFTGLGIDGYDRVTKKWTSYWVDSMGTGAMAMTGTSTDGGKTVTYEGPMSEPSMGQQVPVKIVIATKSDDEFLFTMYSVQGDKDVKVMELAFSRKK